jgi:chemosensory pili system protein ChpC
MSLAGEELYSLLIPLREERLIVPRSCVAEVVRYTPTSEARDDEWLRDTIVWRDREVPVIAFEALLGLDLPSAGGRTRVVVFNPISGAANCPPYGVLAQGFPQMVRVNSEVVQLDQNYKAADDAPVICRINLLSEQALIPDLELLEPRIVESLTHVAG